MNFDPNDLALRRERMFRAIRERMPAWFNAKGDWIGSRKPQHARERLWMCFGLASGDARDRTCADALIARAEIPPVGPQKIEFDIFSSNLAVELLRKHGGRLSAASRRRLARWSRHALGNHPGDAQADYQFHGYNDNMPAMATMGLILGGELHGNAQAVKHGLWNLHQLRILLTRRGLISEYCSPTYTPLTLGHLIEIEHLAHHPAARSLARDCAARIWAELAARFHAPTALFAGPYSRAYTTDSVGHLGCAKMLLWLIYGARVFPNPLEELLREPPRLVVHGGDVFHNLAISTWLAAVPWHPPKEFDGLWFAKKYPYRAAAGAERGDSGAAYPAAEVGCATFMRTDYSLGTAEGEHWEQAEPFFIACRRRAPARGIEDVRVVFARYLINDEAPGMPQTLPGSRLAAEIMHLRNHGLFHALQRDNTALILARPRLELAKQKISRLKLALIFPAHLAPVDRIEEVSGHVFVRDGPILIGIRPLSPDAILRIEQVHRYQLVSMVHYEGRPRRFTRDDLGRMLGGFIATVASTRDGVAPETFRADVLKSRVLDYFAFGQRTVRYQSAGQELEFGYSVHGDRVKHAAVNGRPVPRPRWQADGLPAARLPFLEKPHFSNPVEFPYRTLRTFWYPESPWQISSNDPMRMQNRKR